MENVTNGGVINDGLDTQASASETSKVLQKQNMIALLALVSIAIEEGVFASERECGLLKAQFPPCS